MPSTTGGGGQVGAAKAALRIRLRVCRDAVPASQRAQWSLELVVPALAALRERADAPAVLGAYWPLRSEADPRPLARALAAAGARLALPVVGGDAMAFRGWDRDDELVPAGFGAMGPPPSAPVVVPTVLLVPLLGFDRRGGRLGWGKGYYDRWLAAARPSPWTVGIAFACQEVDRVPIEAHDRALDAVATEREFIPVRRPGG